MVIAFHAHAQSHLNVASEVWKQLNEEERSQLTERYIVQKIQSTSFGKIVDAQGADKSTPGTNGGANLGGAIANSIYTDRWLDGGSYSAKTQLAAILLGQLVGSTLDAKPVNNYQFRYAVKQGDGNIKYYDAYSSEPFRHMVGMCVSLPEVNPFPDQSLCDQTVESLRARVLQKVASSIKTPEQTIGNSSSLTVQSGHEISDADKSRFNHQSGVTDTISCKLPSLAPVKTSKQKCIAINGEVIND